MHNNVSSKEFVLPPELLEEIYKRLVPNDQIRFASVCKAWLSVVISDNPPRPLPLPLPEPWLMLGRRGRQGYFRMYKFHCPSDNRFYNFDDVVPKEYKIATMSSDGWMLTASPRSSHLKLVNLISNTQIRMIPLSPDPYYWWLDVRDIKKLIVLEPRSTSRTESIVTTLIMHPRRSSCRYTMIYTNYKFQNVGWMVYDDIVLYKEELYALIIKTTRFLIQVFDNEQFYYARSLLIGDVVPNSRKDEACLVESCGDLLFVRRRPNNLLQTAGFDVFKLDLANSNYVNAIKLESLEKHQALFWGRQGCFSLPVEESSQFKEDHIYFIQTLPGQPLTEEYGVYSLKDGSIKKPRQPSPSTESFCFFPTVKYTTMYPNLQTKHELKRPKVD